MTTVIYRELGEDTDAQIEYSIGHYGRTYLTTDLELKGRGIRECGDGSDHKRGKKTYSVTNLAFKALKLKYSTCYTANL